MSDPSVPSSSTPISPLHFISLILFSGIPFWCVSFWSTKTITKFIKLLRLEIQKEINKMVGYVKTNTEHAMYTHETQSEWRDRDSIISAAITIANDDTNIYMWKKVMWVWQEGWTLTLVRPQIRSCESKKLCESRAVKVMVEFQIKLSFLRSILHIIINCILPRELPAKLEKPIWTYVAIAPLNGDKYYRRPKVTQLQVGLNEIYQKHSRSCLAYIRAPTGLGIGWRSDYSKTRCLVIIRVGRIGWKMHVR